MIEDVFAKRMFDKFDTIEEKLDTTCDNIGTIKTDVEVLKTKLDNHIENQKEKKSDKKDRKNWYFAIVSFVFFAYIAIKETM